MIAQLFFLKSYFTKRTVNSLNFMLDLTNWFTLLTPTSAAGAKTSRAVFAYSITSTKCHINSIDCLKATIAL